MNEVNKSVLASTTVVACFLALVAGIALRRENDLGAQAGALRASLGTNAYLASNQGAQDVPAGDYFYELSEKLKKEYVEPITDDQKLAAGAVRGMIVSLADPKSVFMGKPEFKAFLEARQGKYEGIGVDLALVMDSGGKAKGPNTADTESNEASAEEALVLGFKIPRIRVINVVPGGPADKAGVKAGDFVYSVDNHWIANTTEVAAFRAAQRKFFENKMPREEFNTLYRDLRKKMDRALMPTKVAERLTVGQSGGVKVVWDRNGVQRTTEMEKTLTQAPALEVRDGSIRLPFSEQAPEQLRKAIEGKKSITIDLRNNVNGDFSIMRECMAMVAPKGRYGVLSTQRKDAPAELVVTKGNPSPPALNLIVDQTTSGAAEIFALALSTHARARLSGQEMGGDRSVRQIVQLPDGSGYTLVTSEYRPQLAGSTIVSQGGK